MELLTAFALLVLGFAVAIGNRSLTDLVMMTQRAVLRRDLSSQRASTRIVVISIGLGAAVGGLVMLVLSITWSPAPVEVSAAGGDRGTTRARARVVGVPWCDRATG